MRLKTLLPLLVLVGSSLSADQIVHVIPLPDPSPVVEVIQVSPENPSAKYKKEKHYLEQVEHKWAKTFYIEDWAVDVIPVDLDTLQNKICQVQCMAASHWNPWTHQGIMFILQSDAYTKEMKKDLRKRHVSVKSDQRDSVVHEILHNVVRNMREELAVQTLTHLLNP